MTRSPVQLRLRAIILLLFVTTTIMMTLMKLAIIAVFFRARLCIIEGLSDSGRQTGDSLALQEHVPTWGSIPDQMPQYAVDLQIHSITTYHTNGNVEAILWLMMLLRPSCQSVLGINCKTSGEIANYVGFYPSRLYILCPSIFLGYTRANRTLIQLLQAASRSNTATPLLQHILTLLSPLA
jgi:hypothetical protein